MNYNLHKTHTYISLSNWGLVEDKEVDPLRSEVILSPEESEKLSRLNIDPTVA